MSPLSNFESLDFVQKVTVLEELKSQLDGNVIPDLLELYARADIEPAILTMLVDTLREHLKNDETMTIKGLDHDSPRVKSICAQICGEQKYETSVNKLVSLIEKGENDEILEGLLFNLSNFRNPELISVFKKYIHHKNDIIAALAVSMLGVFPDPSAIEMLCELIEKNESGDRYKQLNLSTGAAIESIARMNDEKAIKYLVSKIHYLNPAGRLIVHRELINIGSLVIPHVAKAFDSEKVDMRIMAGNILGCIGDKKCGEILIEAFDSGKANDLNVKFAIYEALGNISFIKGIVLLMDGLEEESPMILSAVVSSLNKHVNPGVVKKATELIRFGTEQGEQVLKAVASTVSLNLFSQLYMDSDISKRMIQSITQLKNEEIISAFVSKLEEIEGEQAALDAKTLTSISFDKKGPRILAVDDSKAMTSFYRSTVSEMGYFVTTAENGQEGIDVIDQGEEFDLIFTDMNMPVMDGIEFTRKARTNLYTESTPIIMVTTESEQSQIKLAEEAGVDDFLKKPFTADVLKNKIEEIIAQK